MRRLRRGLQWMDDSSVDHKIAVLDSYREFRLVKVLYDQIKEHDLSIYLLANNRIIHLTRDLFMREMSQLVAMQCGRWHSLEKVNVDPFKVDVGWLIWAMQTRLEVRNSMARSV